MERREIHISAAMSDERINELIQTATRDDIVIMDRQSRSRGWARKVPSGIAVRVLDNYSPVD